MRIWPLWIRCKGDQHIGPAGPGHIHCWSGERSRKKRQVFVCISARVLSCMHGLRTTMSTISRSAYLFHIRFIWPRFLAASIDQHQR